MTDHPVLLIDADADSRQICTLLLHHRGLRALCATCEAEALELARRERPAVIVTELYTRTQDGWRIPEQLRDDPATAGVPLIVLSAHVLSDDRERAFRSGADVFLPKPLDGARLVEEVVRLSGMHGR